MSQGIRHFAKSEVASVLTRRLADGMREDKPIRGLGFLAALDYSVRKAKGTIK